ncbi:MAG: transporter substrate-binding domain-containing protein [bacterium]
MKGIFDCIVLFCIAVSLTGQLSARELKMSYFIANPHIIKVENGIPVGGKVAYFNKYIAPNLNATVQWDRQETPIARLIKNLQTGKADAAIMFAKLPDREVYLYFPRIPFVETIPSVLVRNDFPLSKITQLDELKGFRIGYVLNAFIPSNIKNAGLNFDFISGTETIKRSIKKLQKFRIDAFFDPQDITFVFARKKYGIEAETRILPFPVDPVPLYTVFSKTTVNPELVRDYEEALKKAQGEVNYRKFLESY